MFADEAGGLGNLIVDHCPPKRGGGMRLAPYRPDVGCPGERQTAVDAQVAVDVVIIVAGGMVGGGRRRGGPAAEAERKKPMPVGAARLHWAGQQRLQRQGIGYNPDKYPSGKETPLLSPGK